MSIRFKRSKNKGTKGNVAPSLPKEAGPEDELRLSITHDENVTIKAPGWNLEDGSKLPEEESGGG